MRSLRTYRCRYAASLVFVLLCMNCGAGLCAAQDPDTKNPPTGVLKLEGTRLDYIELHAKDGHAERITRPEETVELPPGEYRLQEVRLKGGYTSRDMGLVDWVTVAVDKPATLKVGGPLVPAVRVQRRGRILRLDYELRGVGGEIYTGGDRTKPPTFAIYRGDKQLTSGKFEFG